MVASVVDNDAKKKSKKKCKKRGRKPKGKIMELIEENDLDSSELPIILHLPIKSNENNLDNLSEDYETSNLFIKSENDNYLLNIELNNLREENIYLKNKILNLTSDGNKLFDESIKNKKCKNNSRCWWCKNCFDTPKISLPDNYFNEKFICFGNFCSYNCALAYNLDLNDEKVWRRESLLLLMYMKTYNKYKKIIPSPSWKVLKEYGGLLTLEQYRDKLILNSEEYLYLHPPMISKLSQIDKKYRKSSLSVPVKNLKKFTESSDDYVLKRSKPLKTSRYSLENTMGLKIIKKK